MPFSNLAAMRSPSRFAEPVQMAELGSFASNFSVAVELFAERVDQRSESMQPAKQQTNIAALFESPAFALDVCEVPF